MSDHETAMLAFARLARISHDKRQASGRDRFLALTAREACLAGWLEIGERCRKLIIAANPRHLLAHAAGIADAVRDPEIGKFLESLDRFCTFEQAEHLLSEMNCWPIQNVEPGVVAQEEIDAITVGEPAV